MHEVNKYISPHIIKLCIYKLVHICPLKFFGLVSTPPEAFESICLG